MFRRAERELEKRKKQQRETIFIKTKYRSFTLEKDSILYIESRAKKVEIHTVGEVIETYASMNEMGEQLGENLYRCHRGYLVNMAYVAEYDSESVTLNNGEYVYLAKEKYGKFEKVYMRYLRNGVALMVEWIMIMLSIPLYLFEGYCIQFFWQVCRTQVTWGKKCTLGSRYRMDCDTHC